MAETLIINPTSESNISENRTPSLPETFPFRRIEFHLARKPFIGFSFNGGGNFRLETLNPTDPNPFQAPGSCPKGGSSALTGRKRDGSEFLEHGLDPELSFRIPAMRIGAGLANLGNTCFLNSVLQCLTYTEPLAAYLQSGKHQVSCRNAGFCALCAIQKHVSRALQSTGRILAPKEIVSNLRCISRSFRNSRQEDAHEYMVNLLESMHKCCLPTGVPSESPSAYDKSLVHKIFGGQLRSQVKCMQCNFCSNKFDPFLDLSLEIAKADNLYKAFANFTAKEHLDGGTRQYQCQQCKQKVKALKQLTIHKAPYILTVHLKRFGSHISGQKIDKKIQFGPTLDLKPFVTGPYDEDLKYTLYGVLVHAGWSTHSGHYYCFVRTSGGMWYALDDNKVFQVSEKRVFEQKAYMLFYFRDRKNFAPKKPADVMPKEKMAINGLGRNKTNPRDIVRGSVLENTSDDTNVSSAVTQRGALNATASKDTQMKVVPPQQNGCLTTCSAINRESLLGSLPKVPPLNDLVKGPSVLHQTGGVGLPHLGSSVEGSSHALNPDVTMDVSTGAKIVSVESSIKKDPSSSGAIPCSFNGPQNSDSIKEMSQTVSASLQWKESGGSTDNNVSLSTAILANCTVPPRSAGDICVTENSCSVKNASVVSCPYPGGRTRKRSDPALSRNQTNSENTLIEDISGVKLLADIAGDDGQRTVDTILAEESSLPKVESFSIQEHALEQKPRGKFKKFLMCQVISMRLGPNILFGKSLSRGKRNKQKRNKKRMLRNKKLSQEVLLQGSSIALDVGPSSSEKIVMVPRTGGLGHSHRTRVKSESKSEDGVSAAETVKTNFSGDIPVNTFNREFRERINKHDAVLATVDQLEKSSSGTVAGSQSESKGQSSAEASRRDSKQSKLMNILTRGLEETTVARWDELESYPLKIAESSGVGSINIGYVGDDWDEEYDRGKRKKVRNSMNRFDGQNPFQEIATKKAKLEQSSSCNRPFRI